jgi:hypothetical protein
MPETGASSSRLCRSESFSESSGNHDREPRAHQLVQNHHRRRHLTLVPILIASVSLVRPLLLLLLMLLLLLLLLG